MTNNQLCTVVNIKYTKNYDVYCGRDYYDKKLQKWIKGEYGNPYVVGIHGKRGECCSKYRKFFYSESGQTIRDKIKNNIKPGMKLACWCVEPGRDDIECHAQIIADYVNNNYQEKIIKNIIDLR
jgi:hypothetical protein